MPSDLIARSRTGDRDAYAGLVGIWADHALQVALQASRDADAAADAVAAAFITAYRELPALFRAHGFRIWLMRTVLEACATPPRDERLRAVLTARGARRQRTADRALSGLLGDTPRLRLPESFHEDRIEPYLGEPSAAEAQRSVHNPAEVWALIRSPRWICAASGAELVGERAPGILAHGALEKPRRSHDQIEVTFTTAWRIGWIVRSAITFVPGELEVCYDAAVGSDAGLARIRGVAIPEGMAGSVMAKLAEDSRDERVRALEQAADRAFSRGAL